MGQAMSLIQEHCTVDIMQYLSHILIIASKYEEILIKTISTQYLFYEKAIPIVCHARSLDHTSQIVCHARSLDHTSQIVCHARSLDHTSQIVCHARSLDHTSQMFCQLNIL